MVTVATTMGLRPKRSPRKPNITPPNAVIRKDVPSNSDESVVVK